MTVLRQLIRVSYRALRDGRTYRRIVHLLLGAVLLLPYVALAWVFVLSVDNGLSGPAVAPLALVAVGAGAGVAVVPGVRALELTAARSLLGVAVTDPLPGSAHAWPARRRGAAWLLLNMLFGGIAAVLILWAVPSSIGYLLAPWTPLPTLPTGPAAWWTVPLGLLLPVLTLLVLAAAGEGVAQLAPRMLGPAPAERLAVELAAAERRAAGLAERARLARELHDSVGHALTVTTLQAGAAAQVLDTDPAFARRALDAIAETGRAALDDLDHVLGLLRQDGGTDGGTPGAPGTRAVGAGGPRAPVRDLRSLPALVAGARSAGVAVTVDVDGDPAALPPAVSREAYRLLQEALTNALRHAGPVPVSVRLTVDGAGLVLVVDNPLPARGARSRPWSLPDRGGGGSGLRGMTERAALLGGELSAGPHGDVWHLTARLPGGVTAA
ncbi:MAG: histidine kinase [Pseudonocardia sp.]|nr:histidine kinase [Pseudonocardia sp.]